MLKACFALIVATFIFQHAGSNDMFEHIVTINADKYTPADDYGLVIGKHFILNISVDLKRYIRWKYMLAALLLCRQWWMVERIEDINMDYVKLRVSLGANILLHYLNFVFILLFIAGCG